MLPALVLLFLVAPILLIVPLSFSSGSFFYYPAAGIALRWYEDFFTSSFWLPSLKNSLIVGTRRDAARDDARHARGARHLARALPGAGAGLGVLISPMVVPVIIVAVGVYFAFAPLGLTDGYLGPDPRAHDARRAVRRHHRAGDAVGVRSHAAARGGEPGRGRRGDVPPRHAAADPARRVRRARVFAFAASFDEVVVALLMAGPGQRTLPRQMFAGINDNISLTITAAATMLIMLACALLVVAEALRRRSELLRTGKSV